MLRQGFGRKEPFESLAPLYIDLRHKDTQAYQHGYHLSQVRLWMVAEAIMEIRTKIPMTNSKDRTGRPWIGSAKARIKRTSKAVKRTPAQRGSLGKSKLSAIADPRSSAKSVLMMAISEKRYRGYKMNQRQNVVCFDRL
jgi:hypothetical protein